MTDDQQSEIDDDGREWFSTESREAPRDIVPQPHLNRAQQQQKWNEINQRREAGETFYFVLGETVSDVDGVPNAEKVTYYPIDAILPPPTNKPE